MDQPKTDYAVLKTYSLTMTQIGKVSDLAQKLGVSQGAVVRQAIDNFYASNQTNETKTATQAA